MKLVQVLFVLHVAALGFALGGLLIALAPSGVVGEQPHCRLGLHPSG